MFNKYLLSSASLVVASLCFSACGTGKNSGSSKNEDLLKSEGIAHIVVASSSELPSCTAKEKGLLAVSDKESKLFICSGDLVWKEVDLKGTPGKDGINGIDGINGKDGINGIDGVNGKDGINGKDGVDGKDGINGKDGVNGKDSTATSVSIVDAKDKIICDATTEGQFYLSKGDKLLFICESNEIVELYKTDKLGVDKPGLVDVDTKKLPVQNDVQAQKTN